MFLRLVVVADGLERQGMEMLMVLQITRPSRGTMLLGIVPPNLAFEGSSRDGSQRQKAK